MLHRSTRARRYTVRDRLALPAYADIAIGWPKPEVRGQAAPGEHQRNGLAPRLKVARVGQLADAS